MKKSRVFICSVLCVVLSFIISACDNTDSRKNNVLESNSSVTDSIKNQSDFVYESSTKEYLNIEQGGGELLPRKYRNNYYHIPSFFAEIVGREACSDWQTEYYMDKYPDNTNEMVMVAYIKEFNISKEDFERANLEYAKFIKNYISLPCLNPLDYADQEIAEVYNTEVIYSFDNELINAYYLGFDYPFLNADEYEEAIANGTYEARTTDWIDINQMEAEIIAKYGEIEQVEDVENEVHSTEFAGNPEETTLPEQTETVTTE